jgi:hypothetical protein
MIWLLVHPLYPPPPPPPISPDSKLDRIQTGRLKNRDNLLTGEAGRGKEPNHKSLIPQESLVLYTSFNTLRDEPTVV